MPNLKETDLYVPVKRWFQNQRGCDPVVADLPQEKRKLQLPRSLRKREVDVVAVERIGVATRVHLAEGKVFARGHSFNECVNQAESVGSFSDYVWVFFQKQQWDALPSKERAQNEAEIRKKQVGLLLVDGERCVQVIPAEAHGSRDEASVQSVLKWLGLGAGVSLPTVPALGTTSAGEAATVMALAWWSKHLISEAILTVAPEARKWDEDAAEEYVEHRWFSAGVEVDSRRYVEVDPFGLYAGDGCATAWVWLNTDEDGIRRYVNAPGRFGTHVYFDNNEWQWRLVPLRDVDDALITRMKSQGFDEGGENSFSIAQRIELADRSAEALKRDVIMRLKEAKAIK